MIIARAKHIIDKPYTTVSGFLLPYNVKNSDGLRGLNIPKEQTFKPGCFDNFLICDDFDIPLVRDHNETDVVGQVVELRSYSDHMKVFAHVWDVTAFNYRPMDFSVGAIIDKINSLGEITEAYIDECSVVRVGAFPMARMIGELVSPVLQVKQVK